MKVSLFQISLIAHNLFIISAKFELFSNVLCLRCGEAYIGGFHFSSFYPFVELDKLECCFFLEIFFVKLGLKIGLLPWLQILKYSF